MAYNSQIGQDAWVRSVIGDGPGFFVELGACDGIEYSNTLFFERELGWKGVCIEPNNDYFARLKKNRRCHVSNALVSDVSGVEKEFAMTGAAGGILDENAGPFTRGGRVVCKTTTTLEAVLDDVGAPSIIDYLSLDVEGHELAILSTFPFHKYKFRCMTVEHNAPHVGPTMQMRIRGLLEANGYRFVKGNDDVHRWGHGPIDDFYVCVNIENSAETANAD
jgi:FkbM family methyltransferase